MTQIKKGDTFKVGGNDKVTVKSVSKILVISPALAAAHNIGTKIQKQGDAGEETEPASPTSPTSPASPTPEATELAPTATAET
eukprot:CAMPEP_0114683410 /NCGR_PEP_ID=MMETSP0191-20121206/57800_1 /TAXON_ID=126664 /ORGANISM="Sorites sp." /LENGTH=82 /DNA_ID=CAMNT_0001964565 /DNA_START=29 /DNA_END=274 /DNA_ORIENTATION=-